MDKTYILKMEIVDQNGETIVSNSQTSFLYEQVHSFGDCEPVDEAIGQLMRSFVSKIESDNWEEASAELETANF